ncbi:hypothetical protein LguiA_016457 [Lonicera macranthoides]
MPLSRYQIRNEYSLADPDLYKAADKDDPEALLEGVAMAGLVGVLRQLGDLAEFASEIFHDLHEEVMATAARGHGLMVRVQQLEVEFPSIEKAFLSQTNHSQFISNPGIEWHPNLHADQNLITQGDLPRFIMDSYEECRGPPRLFLLDKFDVAGAGACLKRYTDPSFFKVEASSNGRTSAEVQRERKARKAKKKGSRWRNGETPEVLPTSHVKLQQLLLEERVENGISDPARLVKLKRRLNGSPFDSKTGKSYMEKIINTPSPEDKVVHEISIGSPSSRLPSNITGESGLEIVEISAVSPGEKSVQRKTSPFSSPDMEKAMLNSPEDELSGDANFNFEAGDILSTLTNEKEIVVDGERKADASGDDYQYNDIASEVDNYMDALATMDSEIETDTEIRAKNGMGFLKIEKQGTNSDANEEQLQAQFSDSQSIGNSSVSDDGNSSSKKGISSFSYSDTASTSAENTPSDENFEVGITDVSSNQVSSAGEIVAKLPSQTAEFGDSSSSSCHTDSGPTNLPVNGGAILTRRTQGEQELDDIFDSGLVGAEENALNVDENLPFTSKLSKAPLHTKDDSLNPVSAIDQYVDKVDEEDSNVFSSESSCFKNILEVAPEEKGREVLLDNALQTEQAEDGATTNSVISVAEEPPFVPALSEFDTCSLDVKTDGNVSLVDVVPSGGEIEVNSSKAAEDRPNITEQHVSEITDDVYPLKLDSADTSVDGALITVDEKGTEIVQSETLVEANSVSVPDINANEDGANTPPSVKFRNLQEECLSSFEESDQKGLEIDETCVQQNHKEPDAWKIVNQQVTSPESNPVETSSDYCKSDLLNNVPDLSLAGQDENCLHPDDPTTAFYDHSDSEVLNNVLYSSQTTEAENTSHLDDATAVPSYSENRDQDSEAENISHLDDATAVPSYSENRDQDSDSKSPQLNNLIEDTLLSPTHSSAKRGVPLEQEVNIHVDQLDAVEIPESFAQLEKIQSVKQMDQERSMYAYLEQKVELQADELDFGSMRAGEASSESTSQLKQMQALNHTDNERCDAASESCLADHPNEASVPEFFTQPGSHKLDISEQTMEPLRSELPVFGLLPVVTEINLDEMPPLPPLPPVQWRMGKPSLASERVAVQRNVDHFPQMFPIKAEERTQMAHPAVQGERTQMPAHYSSHAEEGTPQPRVNPYISDTSSTHASGSPHEELIQPLHQMPQEVSSENKRLEQTLISDVTVVNAPPCTIVPSPTIENEQPHYVPLIAEGEFMRSSSAAPFAPAIEDGKPNGNHPMKLMRPRSPLIDAVAAHDKSKLRKVAERIQPQIQKVDERDSLLEQIRTKSFNLKPAVASRPSIQGPKTNLRVAAILEKANAIRQVSLSLSLSLPSHACFLWDLFKCVLHCNNENDELLTRHWLEVTRMMMWIAGVVIHEA